MKTAILNVTGYAGAELARLLHNHPEIELTSVTGRSAQGQKLGEVFPHLSDIDLVIEAEPNGEEMVFSALPHKSSGERVVPLVEDRSRVVDLSADFRLALSCRVRRVVQNAPCKRRASGGRRSTVSPSSIDRRLSQPGWLPTPAASRPRRFSALPR